MANKHKGSNNERELLKLFSENNWKAVRVAGSGVNDESPCDLIAGKKGRKLAIEAKSTKKTNLYISKEQMNDFIVFANIMSLTPIIAIKFVRKGWFFIKPKQMHSTEKNWTISLKETEEKGKRLGQLIN